VTTEFPIEPQIPNRVTLETRSGDEWQPHPAVIANLTRHEVWIGIQEQLGEAIYPERPVRLVLRGPDGSTQTAETIVLWHIGEDGLVIVLMRPNIWDPPSRRAHSRARLTIPVHLSHDEAAPPVPAWTTNVGVGGVYCLSEVRIPVGQKLPVSLRLTPAESFDCPAEVIRVDENEEDPSGRQVVIALKFLNLTPNDQAKLATALAALAEDVDDEFVPRAWRTEEAAR
jgi:PilZ domain